MSARAQEIFDTLDALLPEINAGEIGSDEGEIQDDTFVFPNRTPTRFNGGNYGAIKATVVKVETKDGEKKVLVPTVEGPTIEEALEKARRSKTGLIVFEDLPG